MKQTPENIPLDSSIGVCVRTLSGECLFQNELCKNLCEKGCPNRNCQTPPPTSNEGMHFFPNIRINGCLSDVVVICHGEKITTLFYPLEEKLQREMEYFKGKGLSKREYQVAGLAAEGLSNRKITKELCISKATLKTHLNVIYKKIPELKNSGFRRFSI